MLRLLPPIFLPLPPRSHVVHTLDFETQLTSVGQLEWADTGVPLRELSAEGARIHNMKVSFHGWRAVALNAKGFPLHAGNIGGGRSRLKAAWCIFRTCLASKSTVSRPRIALDVRCCCCCRRRVVGYKVVFLMPALFYRRCCFPCAEDMLPPRNEKPPSAHLHPLPRGCHATKLPTR